MGYSLAGASHALKSAVWWRSGSEIPGLDRGTWRMDIAGRVMKFQDHGNCNSLYGWEIDHIRPSCLGGSDAITNLQPLHWQSNRKKSDSLFWVPC